MPPNKTPPNRPGAGSGVLKRSGVRISVQRYGADADLSLCDVQNAVGWITGIADAAGIEHCHAVAYLGKHTVGMAEQKYVDLFLKGGVHRRQQAFFHMKCVAVAKQNPLVFQDVYKRQLPGRIQSG